MGTIIQISPETYSLLERRAAAAQTTPEQIAKTAIRLQLGNTIHIEQKQTSSGLQAYIRGTWVAVRHVAAFLQGGYTVDEIVRERLPYLHPAAIYEAIAYYYDHENEINAEIVANSQEVVHSELLDGLIPDQFDHLTGRVTT